MGERFSLAVAGLLVLALAGCTAPADAGPTGTPTPSETASPTLTAQTQGDPQPILPLTCGDVFTPEEASDLLYQPVTLKIDELTVRNVREAAQLQGGLFSCIWGGEFKTDNSWDQSINLDIVADGAAAFDTSVWKVDDGAVVYPEGSTTSEYLCPYVDSGYAVCFANVLVDGYWAHADVKTGDGSGALTSHAMELSMRTIVDTIAAALAGAGDPRAVWSVPAGTLSGNICSGQPLGDETFPGGLAVQRSGALGCKDSSGRSISVLPGGAWALPGIAEQGKPTWWIPQLEPASIAGADTTVWGCGDGCAAFFSIDGSAVSLYNADIYDGAGFTATLPEFVAAVTAAG